MGAVSVLCAVLLSACADAGEKPATSAVTTTVDAVNAFDQLALERILDQGVQEFHLPSAAALVRTSSGTMVATRGNTQRDGDRPTSLDDHIRIGSNTKTWTATVILQLVQEGKIALSDPVSKYRPDVPNGQEITIEQLLNMRSGLYNYSETPQLNQALDTEPERVWTAEELLKLAFVNPPYFAPGDGYHYSNTNYVLLGRIAEQIDEAPLPSIYEARIFKPAGLSQTTYPDTADDSLPMPYVHGYFYGTNMATLADPALPHDMQASAADGTLLPTDVTNTNPSWAGAAGAGISTANDLATWVEELAGGHLLAPALQAQRIASVQSTDPSDPNAPGYGWGLAKFGPLYGHTGELPGYNSFMGTDPDTGTTVVVWANLAPAVDGRGPASAIAKNLIGELYPD